MQNENLKRTFLCQKHIASGARMVPFAGWEMPVSYPAGIIAEHNAVRNSAGIFDIGHMGIIRLSNPSPSGRGHVSTNPCEAQSRVRAVLDFIQSIATNDASKLEENQVQYSVLCNERGGVVDDILVCRQPDHFIIIANASNTDKVLAWLNHFGSSVDIRLAENSCMLSVQGPMSEKIVGEVLGISLSALKRNHLQSVGTILVSRTGYTGEDGFEFILPKSEAPPLWDKLIQKGIQPVGLGARDTLRLEAGLPLYGHEYNDETTPLEAGYSWAVKFDKGDFVGREALLKEKGTGLIKKLVGIEMEGKAIPREGNLVFDSQGKSIGIVTSGTFSPTFKKPIAMAYLEGEGKGLGEGVLVEIRGEKQSGKVVDKGFYKRVK